MSVQIFKQGVDVNEYYRMGECGYLSDDERVELIEGEIIPMAPIGSRHASVVDRLNARFSQLLGTKAIVRVQNPLRLGEFSEPEPDIALVKPRPDFYQDRHPGPNDVFLVVEVIATIKESDYKKIRLYAQYNVSEVWYVYLQTKSIDGFRSPSQSGYMEKITFDMGQSISPQAFPMCEIAINDFLG